MSITSHIFLPICKSNFNFYLKRKCLGLSLVSLSDLHMASLPVSQSSQPKKEALNLGTFSK